MKRIFITGSSEGLGFLAGKILVEQGHAVVLHARNEEKSRTTKKNLTTVEAIVVGDVSNLKGMRSVAEQANALGKFDAVIHNVAVGTSEHRNLTEDGITQLFAVNVVAPYVLTALVQRPSRLIYMSSGMHSGGDEHFTDPQWERKIWSSYQAYSDTKLYDLMLAQYLSRHWKDSYVNAVNPGWVPTRMGGNGAPDDLLEGAATQAWLAASDDAAAKVSGKYFFHKKSEAFKKAAANPEHQDRLIQYLQDISGIKI